MKQTMSRKLKVIGLDPSYRNWGIAIGSASLTTGDLTIHTLDTIHTEAQPKGGRIRASTWDIESAYTLYEGVYNHVLDADIVCIEVPTGSQDAKAALGRGICLGILGSLLSNKMIFVTPQSVKKIIGKDNATKADSVAHAMSKHPEAPWPMHRGKVSVTKAEHSADAVNAIYAGAQTKEFKLLIKEYRHANSN